MWQDGGEEQVDGEGVLGALRKGGGRGAGRGGSGAHGGAVGALQSEVGAAEEANHGGSGAAAAEQ